MKLELNNNKKDKEYNKNKHEVLAEYQKLKKDYEILKKTNIDNLNGHIEIFENLNNNYKEMQDEIDNYKKIIDQKDFEYTNLYSLYNQLLDDLENMKEEKVKLITYCTCFIINMNKLKYFINFCNKEGKGRFVIH